MFKVAWPRREVLQRSFPHPRRWFPELVMAELDSLERELMGKIVTRLALGYVDLSTISSDTPLFGGGLGLDSLDALEIGILIEEDYGIVVGPSERDRSVFGTIRELAQFVQRNLQRDAARL
jgi:acyl carrier protein